MPTIRQFSSLAVLAASLVACTGPRAGDSGDSVGTETAETGSTSETEGDPTSETESDSGLDLPCAMDVCPDGFCHDGGDFVPTEKNPCCGHGYEGDDCGDIPPECDIWNVDDCPDGEKCTAYARMGGAWDANKCVMITGKGAPGDDCVATDGSGVSGNDDCDKGAMCWDIDQDTQTGYCVDFCTGSANSPKCTGDALCAIYNNGVLPLCLPTCDPLSGGADCPNTKNLCVPDPGANGFVCVLDASGGMGPYSTECQYVNSCNQGLYCANADAVPNCQGAQGCCSEFCDVNEPNTCSGMGGGQECVPWYEQGMAPPGLEDVGGCAIPA